MSNTTEVKIKNGLWRRLSARVNRKNIQRLATNFRHTLARIFCLGNGQPSTEAEHEQGDGEKSASEAADAEDVNTETPRSNPDVETDVGDEESSDSDQDGATYDADIESEAAETPRVDGKVAEDAVGLWPGQAGTRVEVLRQLQKQMFMEDTFTTAKPPLPPLGNRAPVHCTRPVCYTPVQEVAPLAPPQKEVAPPPETEIAQQTNDMAETVEDIEEKAIEDMTEEDIDDIINEILAC